MNYRNLNKISIVNPKDAANCARVESLINSISCHRRRDLEVTECTKSYDRPTGELTAFPSPRALAGGRGFNFITLGPSGLARGPYPPKKLLLPTDVELSRAASSCTAAGCIQRI